MVTQFGRPDSLKRGGHGDKWQGKGPLVIKYSGAMRKAWRIDLFLSVSTEKMRFLVGTGGLRRRPYKGHVEKPRQKP